MTEKDEGIRVVLVVYHELSSARGTKMCVRDWTTCIRCLEGAMYYKSRICSVSLCFSPTGMVQSVSGLNMLSEVFVCERFITLPVNKSRLLLAIL